ncbi:MAG: hypothetical protein PHW76_08095 [Alphaproteobacteria bacterium]|nr:hypothetical protein [Alphaproteobacteria bacterium]
MKLYEIFGKSGFHTTIATSFGIDFGAYENMMLSRLRGAGCNNNLIVVDAGMLSLALEGIPEPPHQAGLKYTVTPASAKGVFHPKLILQLGQSSARLIVSSANITAAGLAGNLEVAGMIEVEDKKAGEARLVAASLSFISTFFDQSLKGTYHQLSWMHARTSWLHSVEPAEGIVKLSDGSDGAFFCSNRQTSIATRFLNCLDGKKIHRLIVISPYWDDDLSSLNLMLAKMSPSEAYLLLDQGRQVFSPEKIAHDFKKRVKLIDFKAKNESRFIHAKVIIAQTNKQDHVLYGSANCTRAALGNERFGGSNAEACLYRALPSGAAINALGLEDELKAEPISHRGFQSAVSPPDIPLNEIAARFPGHFTCIYEKLIWSPPHGTDPAKNDIELLDKDKAPMTLALKRIGMIDDAVHFQLSGPGRPAFARVRRCDGSLSAPAIVVILEELRDAVKDARNRRIEAALAQLEEETDLGLSLLEILDELEAAEMAISGEDQPMVRRQGASGRKGSEHTETNRKLSYEQFISGRRLRSEIEERNQNGLAGSHLSSIRSFLNRLLDIGETKLAAEEAAAEINAFNLGDETSCAEDAIESGEDFNNPSSEQKPSAKAPEELSKMCVAEQRQATREQIISAVENLVLAIPEKARSKGLRCSDLLRLRAIIMILSRAAWNGATPPKNSLQVLPMAGDVDAGWPRLLGKVLFAYFGGNRIAIHTLVLDDFYDQIPDDILECWASCIWAIQAIIVTTTRLKEYESLSRSFEGLRDSIYRLIGLQQEDMQDKRIIRVLNALSSRFGNDLDLDYGLIEAAHQHTALTVLKHKVTANKP